MKLKALGLVVIALFLLATAGAASAASLDLPKWVIVPEDSTFSDVTLFCGLDAMDTTNNVTPCYYQGSLVNATIYFNSTTGYPKIVAGKILSAFEFSGTSAERVQISALNNQNFAQLYISFWVKLNGYSDRHYFVSKDMGATGITGFAVSYWQKYKTMQFRVGNGTNPDLVSVSDSTLDDGQWHFVEAIFNGTHAWIAVDMNKIAEIQTTISYVATATGYVTFSSYYYPLYGTLDEVRIYDRVPTNDERRSLYLAGRKKLSEPANFRQIFSPMIDLTRDRATFYAGLEVSTSDPNGYVPVPESAVNMSITSAERLTSDYTGADFYYQGHYWYRADKIQFNLPIQFETLREKNSFAKEILLDDDSKTFIYEKEFRVTNPTATKINVLYTVDPTALGFSVLQYPQFELDGVPMAEWRPGNSTTLYLIRTDSLEPGEISTHWMKSIWTISKEELEFPAKLDDFRSITTFEQARKLAENAVEGKTDTYVKVIKIDSNADVNNVTILVPLKDVEDSSDVIEVVALTGSRETLQVEELPDGKIVVKVPSEAFVSGHAEIKVLYNKEGKSGIFAIISKILAKIKDLLRKLGLSGLVFWPVSHA